METSNRWVAYLFAVIFGLILVAKGLTLYTDSVSYTHLRAHET